MKRNDKKFKEIDEQYGGKVPEDLICDVPIPRKWWQFKIKRMNYKFSWKEELAQLFKFADVGYENWIIHQAKSLERGLWDLRFVIFMILTNYICLWQLGLHPEMSKSLLIVMFIVNLLSIATIAAVSIRYNILLSTFVMVLVGVSVIPMMPNLFLKRVLAIGLILLAVRLFYKLVIKEIKDIRILKEQKKIKRDIQDGIRESNREFTTK